MGKLIGRRFLITGASVAGNTLAWWLARQGATITVVERAPRFRDGGQNVDVRGAARDVLRRMGLDREALRLGTGETGVRFVDERDRGPLFAASGAGGETFTQEMEILRGDLAKLLLEQAASRAVYRFDDAIAAIEDDPGHPDGASVTFQSGAVERYDRIIVAEGVGATTRDMIFPGENRPLSLDMVNAYCTIPKGRGDGETARWFTADRGRGLILRPDRHGSTRALFIVRGGVANLFGLSVSEQKAFLSDRFSGLGWECRRAIAGMEASDTFYFDTLRQVRMPRWSKGRVTLCGDAAWCATPVSGVGTSLALMGAYALAGELSGHAPEAEALSRYEAFMRPIVETAQGFPRFVLRLGNPQGRFGVRFKHAVLSVAAQPAVRAAFATLVRTRSDKVELPTFEMAEA